MRINEIININDFYYEVFMSISKALTGFSIEELQSTGLSIEYYNYILNSMESGTFVEFLSVSKSILETSSNEDELKKNITDSLVTAKDMKVITSKIINVWYLGSWNGTYITQLSYTEGLIWKLMESHPPGAKQPGFKSWSVKPFNS